MPVALVSVEANNLDDQVKSMIGVSENMLNYGNDSIRARVCKVCGKEGHLTNIKTHIESNHLRSDVSHSCDICGKISRSRNGLRKPKARDHTTLFLFQDQKYVEGAQEKSPFKFPSS